MADRLGHQFDVGLVQPDPFAHVARHDLTGDAVVTGPALPDVVQQRRQQQQVGAGDVAGQGGGVGGALHQVPVDREAVQRVALRPVPYPLPVRDQRGQQPLLVERLPDRDRARPGPEQGKQLIAGLGRPGNRQRRALRQPGQGTGRERQADLRRRGGRPQDEHRILLRHGGAGQDHLAVLLDHPVGERAAVQLAPSHPHAKSAPAAGPVGLPEGVIDRVGDGTARAGQLAEQCVAVEQPQRAGHLVLLFEHEAVQAPAGDLVQHVTRVKHLLVGGPHLGSGGRGDPGRRDRLDGVHVALPAPALLEVGLKQEGQLAVEPRPLLVQRLELGQPGPGVGPPVLQGALAQPRRQVRVAPDVPGVQQPKGHLEVIAGHPSRLRHGPHGMVKPRAGVPDRVPDPVRDPRDAIPAVMEHQHVKIAAGKQFLAAVTANRDQSHTRLGTEHARQPAIRFSCPSAAISRVRSHHVTRSPE